MMQSLHCNEDHHQQKMITISFCFLFFFSSHDASKVGGKHFLFVCVVGSINSVVLIFYVTTWHSSNFKMMMKLMCKLFPLILLYVKLYKPYLLHLMMPFSLQGDCNVLEGGSSMSHSFSSSVFSHPVYSGHTP